jgi:hypothetical protein
MPYGFADSSQAALFSLSIRSRHRMFVVLHRIALHCIASHCICLYIFGEGYKRPFVLLAMHAMGVFKSDDRTA